MPIAALAALVLTAMPGPPAPGAGGSGCDAPGARTVARSRVARVFEVQRGEATFVYGCARANQRRTLLGMGGGIAGDPGPAVELIGATVAVIREPRVRTIDLRTGRRLRSARVGAPIAELELRRDGSFGAIAAGRVIKVDGDGRTVADRATGLEPGSLRSDRRSLRWRRSGADRLISWWFRAPAGCRRGRVVARSSTTRVVRRGRMLIGCATGDLRRGLHLLAEQPDAVETAIDDGVVVALTPSCRLYGWDVPARTRLTLTRVADAPEPCADAGSLHVTGTTATWTRAGAPHSLDLAAR